MAFFKSTGGLILLAFVAVQGAAIFQDDFSNPANSDSNWPIKPDLQRSFDGGKCTVTNSNANYAGLLTHNVSGKPAEFTFSASVTRVSDTVSAGIYVNSVSNALDGYAVQVGNQNQIYVTKFGTGDPKVIFKKQNGFVLAQTNNLVISKKSTTFYIYCNDQYMGSFTDADIAAVAVGFILSPKVTVSFDNVILTNTVTLPPSPPSSFNDDFNDGKLTGWMSFGNQADVSEADSVLKIQTKNDSDAFMYRDFMAAPFCTLKVEVSHRGGDLTSLYGLFFCDKSKSGIIPIAGFGITGSSYYGVLSPDSGSISLDQNTCIRGKAYISGSDTVYKKDTLKIIDSSGNYKCYANGVLLSSFSNINFSVTGVGLFCDGGQKIYFDNFYVDNEKLSVTHFIQNKHSTLNFNAFSRGNLLVDPLGRLIPVNNIFNKSKLASGIYLTNKKTAGKVLITK